MLVQCTDCGKSINKKLSRVFKRNFCPDCNKIRMNVGRVAINCKYCHKEFKVYPKKKVSTVYCSAKCQHSDRFTGKTLTCKICGKEFYKANNLLKKDNYCSIKCSALARSKKATLNIECKGCGNSFQRKKYLVKVKDNFCSEECYWNYKKDNSKYRNLNCSFCNKKLINRKYAAGAKHYFCNNQCFYEYAKIHPLKSKKGHYVECGHCGKEKYIRPARYKRYEEGLLVFCNSVCYALSLKSNKPQKCVICGSDYYVSVSQQKYRIKKTCSKKCQKEWASIIHKGEKSSFWRGGVSSENRIIRYSYKMVDWRLAVFQRDDYTCQSCGARNGKGVKAVYLHAHHIKPFALNKELRFDVSNGATLCKQCHTVLHKTDAHNVKAIIKHYKLKKSLS